MAISHILVGTDFSEPAARAVRFAADWAQRFGARVTLVHALSVPELNDEDLEQPILEHRELEAAVHQHLDRLGTEMLDGIDHRTVMIRARSASEALTQLATEGDVDLIVVGTHGRSGIERLLLGSVAEQVSRLATCPVMTVPSI